MDIAAHFMEIGPWTLKHSLWTVSYVDLTGIYPICFFDGSSSEGTCGCGISLHLDPTVQYHFSWHGGWGDNCRDELIVLWGALKCSSWLGIDSILISRDSLVLINSIQGRFLLRFLLFATGLNRFRTSFPHSLTSPSAMFFESKIGTLMRSPKLAYASAQATCSLKNSQLTEVVVWASLNFNFHLCCRFLIIDFSLNLVWVGIPATPLFFLLCFLVLRIRLHCHESNGFVFRMIMFGYRLVIM